ncbi:putative DNA helicase chromatin remodeling SNF2 family [Dioscorea sansibarensis]
MPDKEPLRREHPIDATPFEVFYDGSWHGVDQLKVKDGSIFVEPRRRGSSVEYNINAESLRLRSRRAIASDCGRFLKAGVDVCVLSAHSTDSASEKGSQPLFSWRDAKVISVKRTGHEGRCTCLFSVVFYRNEGEICIGSSRHERKSVAVKLDNISILQRLKFEPFDDGSHQWSVSEDCGSIVKAKLLTDAFSSETSWLVVLSALKGVEFVIKAVGDRIVHHISNNIQALRDMVVGDKIVTLGFHTSGEKWHPKIETLAPVVPKEIVATDVVIELDPTDVAPKSGSDVEILYEHSNLRHSKRRKTLPDRFVPVFNQGRSQEIVASDLSKNEEASTCLLEYPSSQSVTKHPPHRRKLLSTVECKEIIKNCMGDIQSEIERLFSPPVESGEKTPPVESVEKTRQTTLPAADEDFNWSSEDDTPPKDDENEELWREMDHALTTLALLEQKQDFGLDNSDKDEEQRCQHEYTLDEEVGLICHLCKYVCTEIRDVWPPFVQNARAFSSMEKGGKEEFDWIGSYEFENSYKNDLMDTTTSLGCDDVWNLIPEYRSELRGHQKRAFEFVWRNIAGCFQPPGMDSAPAQTGGCVISHSPGSGKTLLVISFLVSHLKVYPRCRPLVLAPKIATYTWCKEFEKWGVSVPLYEIHPAERFKKGTADCKLGGFSKDNRRPSKKTMHVMDCLLKLKLWHEQPGVLLMSYSSFFTLTQNDSKLEYRRFMANVLQKSPGILILDEGHNPRSTTSKLRRNLMKVKTDFRILLSGTLFQNNFEEYFNSLALGRPRFIRDLSLALDPDTLNRINSRSHKRTKRASRVERLARKLFVEKVGQKIESNSAEVRKEGFDLLNKLTGEFVDVFEGESLDTLPGLQIYTLLLTSTDIQREILVKVTKLHHSIRHKRCPLELELLITVGSIHPWLIKTVACVRNFFTDEELEKVEKCKGNFRCGSKVKFVVDLVHKSTVRGERVLVFCHNISPINMFAEVLESVFGWQRGEEILILQGDQELSVRAKIMDKFNRGAKENSRVLLASTNACAEGISLTAASRVVLVDSEWNHSKTRQAIARAFRPGQERVVYVYRLLASGTWEEDKYDTNAWKAWLSKMVFIGQYIRYPSTREVEDIEDEVLRELVEEDKRKTFQMVMKHD